MNDPMTMLKTDHRETRKVLRALADSDEGPEREEMLAKLRTMLSLHMEIEERLVYPSVAELVGEEDREEADIEHRLTREAVQHAVDLVSEPGFGAVIAMLQAGIEHHVEEEETEILPELKEKMARDDWRALGDAIAAAKAEAGEAPAPPTGRRSTKRKPKAKAKARG